ncbi:MAG: phosphatidate cytidylyltransferase [Alphaproteobacteria bacterium]|nr:phosphatidate cytidylyltransferase [Alphaproteobacteria bacterium]
MAKSKSKKTTSKKLGSLAKRILTALVMLPVAIGALWVGYPFVDVLALIVGVLLAWEWTNMVSNKNPLVYLASYITSVAVSLFVYDTPMIVSSIVLISFFVWFKAKNESHRNLLTLGVAYISIGIGSLLWIYHGALVHHPYNFYMTLWFFIMVWAMDIGGFIIGCNLKGPKLAPKISPNKTWSGLIGGIVFAMVASYLYIWLLAELSVIKVDDNTQTFFVVLGGIIAAVSQIGDLIESAIKRKLGVKDSSSLIPGHGGVFDRVDGLIFAAPFVYWLFAYGL